ncbi:hypothetical protein EJ110_NYTH10751 [Nymphaea thermarum]|nr:hypothetical protein EJ110_NYTH10751 [Nymphaea thermarum]
MRAIFLPLASLPLSESVLQNRAAHFLFCSSGFSISGWSRSVLPKSSGRRRIGTLIFAASSSSPEVDEWIDKLPDKKKPIYSHSLPCIEAWLNRLGFRQTKDDPAVWLVRKLEWHAQLSLDVTDLCIRYLKTGPGELEKDVERRFSYALSREDIENAILGGP